MSARQRKAPSANGASHSDITQAYVTSLRGRRAIVHLWTAARAVAGAALTLDDKTLILEALAEIQGVLK